MEFHKSHGKLATLTAVKMAQDKGVLDITKDQAVRAFREKNASDGAPINVRTCKVGARGSVDVLHPHWF